MGDNNFYKAVVETMHDGLLVVNTEGIIQAVNAPFEAMTGYSCVELVGRRCTILNCTGCRILDPKVDGPWCNMFIKGGVRNRRCSIEAKNGKTVEAIKSATVLRDECGRLTGAVETMRDISELVHQEEKINRLRFTLKVQSGNSGIVGSSVHVQRLLDLIQEVAQSEAPVLIYGESGVGKELVAQAIHDLGKRSEGPFVKVNCASLNENLLESELFGHVKGAFTGADRNRVGRFEAASSGTIFLDEIGDVPSLMQVKLLRVLEAKEIERVGDLRAIPVDARVVTATNKELENMVAQGAFRSDLFFRINVIPVFVPPLRQRKEDIPLLAQTFIDQIASRSNKSIVGLDQEALDIMLNYNWPGNVRELRNVIEYAFVMCREGLIGPEHVVHRINSRVGNPPMQSFCQTRSSGNDFFEGKHHRERTRLLEALREAGGNQTEAARILGISRVTVWKRMKRLGITAYIRSKGYRRANFAGT
jgi:two-component system, NtrC family, response regulator HydG